MPEPTTPTRWTPTRDELADTELLLDGVLAPLSGFLTASERDCVRRHGKLPDGTPWHTPVTLHVPREIADQIGDDPRVDLTDPEGTPIARLTVTDRAEVGTMDGPAADANDLDLHAGHADDAGNPGTGVASAAGVADVTEDTADSRVLLGGPLAPLQPREDGLFRDLRRTPEQLRAVFGGGTLLAATVEAPLAAEELSALAERAQAYAGVVLLPLLTGEAAVVSQVGLVQASLAAARSLPGPAEVVPVVLGARPRAEHDWLAAQIGAAYGDDSLQLAMPADLAAATRDALARDVQLPVEFPPEIAAVLRVDCPPRHQQGAVVLLTGLSGSGKSTVARRLRDLLLERGDRTVTLLDGDVVRRMLSSGLGFSRQDRITNVRRIGYVAAEVARHGGLALCAPIAPYADVRADLRAMATDAGAGFVLVHVATPLAECERRDRKGLYAKARRGEIAEFTGISDPYEEPTDADLRLDTTDTSVDDAATQVVDLLRTQGWLT